MNTPDPIHPGTPAHRLPWLAALAFLLIPLIAACEFTVSGTVTPSTFQVTSASLSTNYEATVNGETSFVICDDRSTDLTYSFTYQGELASWRSYLRGTTTGQEAGDVTLTPGDPRVEAFTPSRVQVRYTLLAGSAPLLQSPEPAAPTSSAPQEIIVVPTPQVIGYTRLYLQVQGYSPYGFGTRRASDDIPVLSSCG